MYYYIDEAGHTGLNLFDDKQPTLYYGVLGASADLDVVAEKAVSELRAQLAVERLHAAELGMKGLCRIACELIELQDAHGLVFDLFGVKKEDHAVICFFDQVFDSGMNEAVPWHIYWTPLRFALLLRLAMLFDRDLKMKAWEALICRDNRDAEASLVRVCGILRARAGQLSDLRTRELIDDALAWAQRFPARLSYNCQSKGARQSVSPNLVGFQFVMHGIAARGRGQDTASRIVVDLQSEFNKAQTHLASLYRRGKPACLTTGLGMPTIDLSNIPEVQPEFKSSKASAGLELVDVFLWLFCRVMRGEVLPSALMPLVAAQLNIGVYDEVSLDGLASRWSPYFVRLFESGGVV